MSPTFVNFYHWICFDYYWKKSLKCINKWLQVFDGVYIELRFAIKIASSGYEVII